MTRTVKPGWYTVWPKNNHFGGSCIYCFAIMHYVFEEPYSNLPEMSDYNGSHILRRMSRDEQVVYELEGRRPDYDRSASWRNQYGMGGGESPR